MLETDQGVTTITHEWALRAGALLARIWCVCTGGHDYYKVLGPRHIYVQCISCLHKTEGIKWEAKSFTRVVPK